MYEENEISSLLIRGERGNTEKERNEYMKTFT
jgi:hypothetical protein